jgi:EpsI family protein
LHRVISRIWKNSPVAPRDPAYLEKRPGGGTRVKAGSLRFRIVAILMLATALGLQAHSHSEFFPRRLPLTSFPVRLGLWADGDLPIGQDVLDILGRGEFLNRNYRSENDLQSGIGLFIAYYPSQRTNETPHSPQHCLAGAGFIPIRNDIVTVSVPGHEPFPANRYFVSKGNDRALVLYWFWAHDRGVASEYWAKYYLIRDSIMVNRSDGALVRITTGMYPGESIEAAQQRILPFVTGVVPLLNDYIPR